MRALAVLTVRNEAAFLLEWLAHHQATGFSDFLVFSNDCQDGSDRMLGRLQELGHLTHLRNDDANPERIQFSALKRADKHPLRQQADWLMQIDIDEFVNIHVGDRTLPALFEALPDATAITLTWRHFGCAGQARYDDLPVTEQFTQAAPRIVTGPWRLAMLKTLFRNDGTYRKMGVHRPRQPDPDRLGDARWFDGSGRALGADFATKRLFSDYRRDNYQLAQLNHYATGSMESYVLKSARGRAVSTGDTLGLGYWVERNLNVEEDRSILALAAKRRARQDVLMADAELARLHEEAVDWRRSRFEELLAEERYRALYARLQMSPASAPLRQEAADFLQSHGLRAQHGDNPL